MSTLTENQFFTEIDSHIDANRYSRHSFVKTLLTGEIPAEKIKNWAIQKYFQTFMQNRTFSSIHSAAPHEDVRQFMVQQLIGEETALMDGTDSHYNLMKRFALALGATEEEILNTEPGDAVLRFVSYMIETCRTQHFTLGLLANYVNERQTPESAMKMYGQFQKQFNHSDETLEWFLVHGSADVDHANDARHLIYKYAGEVPDFMTRAKQAVTNGCNEWRYLHDFYYSLITNSNGEK